MSHCQLQPLDRIPRPHLCFLEFLKDLPLGTNCQQRRTRSVANKPVLPGTRKIRRAYCCIVVESDSPLGVFDLHSEDPILEGIHLILVGFDVALEGWFVTPFSEISVRELVVGV